MTHADTDRTAMGRALERARDAGGAGEVPVGAVITGVKLAIFSHDGVLTVNLGDGNDVSRYGASVVLSGTAITTTSLPARGLGYAYTAEDTVDIKIGAISAASANGVLLAAVTYFVICFSLSAVVKRLHRKIAIIR